MTELNSHSIESNLSTAVETTAAPNLDEHVIPKDCDSPPVVVSCPRLDSKLILQNMEEVLHTVKKQHKEKHRRKKELKKLAMIEAAAATSANNSTESMATSDSKEEQHVVNAKSTQKDHKSQHHHHGHHDKNHHHSDKKHKHRDKDKRHSKKKPLQEKSTVENGKVLQESPVKSGTILQHFQRTPKKETVSPTTTTTSTVKDDEVQVIANEDENENTEKVETPPKNSKVTNAFEVMMNARNKTIGSNTPGKDSPSPVVDKEATAVNVKRKLKLQEWAEQKGATKRKLEEEARAAYVDEQLEQRAKR